MSGAGTEPSDSLPGEPEAPGVLPGIHWVFPALPGSITPFERSPIVLGRDADGPGRTSSTQVSRRHAQVRCNGDVVVLSDLGSTNGTFVNGARIKDQSLRERDVVRLGTWIGVVVPDAGSARAATFETPSPGLLVGPDLASALEQLRRLAPGSVMPIVLEGETGTGKERVARAVHLWSGRKGPFVAINAAAIPESMAEAELFGHRKGAFTGAERAAPGYLRAAQGGTLLIDEVVDLPLPIQAKLLRCLENREVIPLGETVPVPIDVRIVTAAPIPLREAVAARTLRPDLVARLDGLTVRLPPLRERVREVPFLFASFLAQHLGPAAPCLCHRLVERLCLYDWPFNVRELAREAERLAGLHADAPILERRHLSPRLLQPGSRPAPAATGPDGELGSLAATLRLFEGNVARAAEALGMSRQRAYRLMDGTPKLDPATFRRPAPAADFSRRPPGS